MYLSPTTGPRLFYHADGTINNIPHKYASDELREELPELTETQRTNLELRRQLEAEYFGKFQRPRRVHPSSAAAAMRFNGSSRETKEQARATYFKELGQVESWLESMEPKRVKREPTSDEILGLKPIGCSEVLPHRREHGNRTKLYGE